MLLPCLRRISSTRPVRMLRDLLISVIWSQVISSTDDMLWVEKMTVEPLSRKPRISSFKRLALDRIETRKRLVEDQQLRFVQHRDDELDFLGHTLRKFVHLAVPPRFDAEFDEPLLEPHHRFVARKPFRRAKKTACSPTFIFLYRPRSSGR